MSTDDTTTSREAMATALSDAHKAQYRPDSVSLPEWGGL